LPIPWTCCFGPGQVGGRGGSKLINTKGNPSDNINKGEAKDLYYRSQGLGWVHSAHGHCAHPQPFHPGVRRVSRVRRVNREAEEAGEAGEAEEAEEAEEAGEAEFGKEIDSSRPIGAAGRLRKVDRQQTAYFRSSLLSYHG
jgi:hypothetical protein